MRSEVREEGMRLALLDLSRVSLRAESIEQPGKGLDKVRLELVRLG